MSDVAIYRKSFTNLLHDAAWFTVHARDGADKQHPWGNQRFTRSAILYSGLLIECTANCCINNLGLEKDSEKDLEFAKTFTKYDAFLLATTDKLHVPRDHIIVKRISELISIRNGFAHSKVTSVAYTETGNVLKLKKDDITWNTIDIPRNSDNWLPLHAERAFVAVSDFLNFFFFHLASFDTKNIDARSYVAQILSSEIEHVDPSKKGSFKKSRLFDNPIGELFDLRTKFDLDYAYLGYYAHDGQGTPLFPRRELGTAIK